MHWDYRFFLKLWRSTGLALAVSLNVWASRTWAIDQETWLLVTEPPDIGEVTALWEGQVPADGSVVTSKTISQTGLTVPSLWWTDEQFGNDLLTFWVAYTGVNGSLRRVDLLVDQQAWTRYNYLQRYAFVIKFGKAGQDFGYQTRVLNWRGELLAVYVCNSDQLSDNQSGGPIDRLPQSPPAVCNVFLDPFDPNALRGG